MLTGVCSDALVCCMSSRYELSRYVAAVGCWAAALLLLRKMWSCSQVGTVMRLYAACLLGVNYVMLGSGSWLLGAALLLPCLTCAFAARR
jgi:hypothetical protein